MNIREKILQQAYTTFSLPYREYANCEFTKYMGDFTSTEKFSFIESGNYKCYAISDDFEIFFTDYNSGYITSLFLPQAAKALIHLKSDHQIIPSLHRHQYFELIYIINGHLDLMIEGAHHRLYAHDICITNQNARHVEEYLKEYTAIYLCIKPNLFTNMELNISNSSKKTHESFEMIDFITRNNKYTEDIDYLTFKFISPPDSLPALRIERLISQILNEMLEQETAYTNICQHYLTRLFSYLNDSSAYVCSNTHFHPISSHSAYEKTLGYINLNRRKVSRAELGEALHYNGDYISQIFQQQTGQTLADYIRNVCLTEAADLLLNTNMNISDIILKINYDNKTAFYNQFKRKYGVSPNEYRKNRY